VSSSAGIACTNSPEDFGGGSSGTVSARRREPNAASGEISGDPQTPEEQELTGGETDGEEDTAPPPSSDDPGTPPPPPPPDPGADPDPPAPDPDPPIPAGSYAVGTQLVTTANLNIREGADTTYAIVTTAPNGSTVTVVSVSGASGWVNISWNGNVGWSSKAYLTPQ
jgi:uncharacterized protein YgiM (DUF1202 family)